jgi:acetyl-CoA acetyltransferase family protein
LEAIVQAARLIQCGEASVVLAGGMENMSQAPHVVRGGRTGFRFGSKIELEDLLFAALKDTRCNLFMAETAENAARKYGITREAQDDFAFLSMRRAVKATEAGIFNDEVVAVEVRKGRETVRVTRDDHLKPESTREGLGKLKPAFGADGTVTAGNASGIVDGAAAVIVASREVAEREGFTVLAKILGASVVGVEPEIMGIGPAPAIRTLLKKLSVSKEQVDLFEINEAFAAQYLAVEKDLGLDRDRVNVNGGAIGLGHPLGATGTRLALTLGLDMRRRKAKLGVASACIGGGQGIALALGGVA